MSKRRDNLKINTLVIFRSMMDLYGKDRAAFLDIIMFALREDFGRGEILEYLMESFNRNDTEDHRKVASILDEAIEAIPDPEDFCLHGDEIDQKSRLKFERIWNFAKKGDYRSLERVLEKIQKYITGARTAKDRELANDMISIVIFKKYKMPKHLKHLSEKYQVR